MNLKIVKEEYSISNPLVFIFQTDIRIFLCKNGCAYECKVWVMIGLVWVRVIYVRGVVVWGGGHTESRGSSLKEYIGGCSYLSFSSSSIYCKRLLQKSNTKTKIRKKGKSNKRKISLCLVCNKKKRRTKYKSRKSNEVSWEKLFGSPK